MATSTAVALHHLLAKPLDLEVTIVSAKQLKNVNWRNGDLNPYAIFWIDPDRRLATKSDDSNSTKPVWNQHFVVPLPSTPSAAVLTLEIFHAKPSDTPKPLVGTLRVSIGDLPDPENPNRIRIFELRRPSGRINGKIRLKLAIRERPLADYRNTPQEQYYYSNTLTPAYGRIPSSPSPYGSYGSLTTPPPAAASPAPAPFSAYVSQTDPYSVYYPAGYYAQPPPFRAPSPRPSMERQFSYVGGGSGGPSAPMEFGQYDQKPRSGGITRGLAGLAIDEGLRYDDEKISERFETDIGVKKPDNYTYYRRVEY